MPTKFTPRRCFWIVLIFLLVACGNLSPRSTPTPAPTFTPIVETPIVLPTLIPFHSPLPTLELLPTVTANPTLATISIAISPEIFPLDNLRVAYIAEGNLYIQDGNNLPKQLSNSGEDLSPIFSSDGEKVVFYRGAINDDNHIYSINSDGSSEKALVTNNWLTTLGRGTKAGSLAFVPGTHQLIFNTYLCPGDLSLGCTIGLFLVDTDTGEIKEILPPSPSGNLPWSGRLPWHGNFAVSPDGELVSIAISGYIDIFTINGVLSQRNVMTYTRSTPIELFPRVFWRSDSRGLIVALPAESNYGGTYEMTPNYTVWKYDFDSNTAMQTPLNPPPTWMYMECGDVISVSPDGNWVIYHPGSEHLYIGNLKDGNTQSYLQPLDCSQANWSSDNAHFIYGGRTVGYPVLGSVDAPPASIPGFFWGWIDAQRYIYSYLSFPMEADIQLLVGEIGRETLLTYQSNVSIPAIHPSSFTFTILGDK